VRALLTLVAVLLLAGAVFVGLRQASSDADADAQAEAAPFDVAEAQRKLAGAPAPLSALHDQANQLLTGGPRAFRQRLADLEGHPVVINKWASWCGPCRAEAPALQSEGIRHGRRVAFLGVDWRDSTDSARDFLSRHGMPFPSYEDREGEIADMLDLPQNIPVTLFLDERGELAYLHQGGYRSAADLAADIDRYLPAS
jgi:cytochrome c biogenesis protein CcmG/thiol:disulfide interchange protein DsbE